MFDPNQPRQHVVDEHIGEEAIPTFLSSGRWVQEENSRQGFRAYR